MIMDYFYAHRVEMIERSSPEIASLYRSDLLKVLRDDTTLKFSEKEAIRIYADLALQASEARFKAWSTQGSHQRRAKATLWQRFRAWAGR